MAQPEGGTLHQRHIRHGHIGVMLEGVRVEIETHAEDRLQHMAGGVVNRAVVGAGEDQRFPARDDGDAVVFRFAVGGQDVVFPLVERADEPVRFRPADKNPSARQARDILLGDDKQRRAADLFNIIPQFFRRVAFQPGRFFTRYDDAARQTVLCNLHIPSSLRGICLF